ncbi:hypothetical protein F2P81_020524 [Scophthalmus maximus]|uniref:DNA helicase MCM8 n=1 Tax=Scophthalmus maximus TaxID=52904 RepID=A0A6A4S087_SCOMX|nr:hypothetical protein F2P81_020524 [Scophthalmus maximus]
MWNEKGEQRRGEGEMEVGGREKLKGGEACDAVSRHTAERRERERDEGEERGERREVNGTKARKKEREQRMQVKDLDVPLQRPNREASSDESKFSCFQTVNGFAAASIVAMTAIGSLSSGLMVDHGVAVVTRPKRLIDEHRLREMLLGASSASDFPGRHAPMNNVSPPCDINDIIILLTVYSDPRPTTIATTSALSPRQRRSSSLSSNHREDYIHLCMMTTEISHAYNLSMYMAMKKWHTSAFPNIALYQTTLDAMCPYKGWLLYFTEGFIESSPSVEKIKVFEKYFASKIHLYDKDEIERQGSVLVDYADLMRDQTVCDALPDLTTELKEQPEIMLNCLGVAIHQVLTVDLEKQAAELKGEELSVATPVTNIPHISARLYNYEPLTPLRTLRASVFGRLCIQPDCRSRSFLPSRSSPLTHTVDWQIIKVQELMGGEQRETGRIPRTVECHLTSDLCDSCVPGDTVTVTGIVRVTNDGSSRVNKDQCMFLLYLDATSVSNTKGHKSKSGQGSRGSLEDRSAGEEFTLKELYAIQEIQSQPGLLRLIVHSLCPVIYGQLLVKAALALTLFGGRQKHTDKNSVPVRGDPHILMVGDPGLGKSQMLQAVCNVAPRGIYVCGNSTSTTGLTVSLSRDSGTGDFALEAGALVLADQGLCCIDEFDKLGHQQQALLEAMEQQSVSLAKAGIVSSLPARTSVIAAANPIGGHYNRGKTVSENLKMGSALLSRFDVVFLLLDIPDESHDRRLSEHVMANRAGRGRTSSAVVTRAKSSDLDTSILLEHSDIPLSERLQARARLDLRETATKSDAEDVVEIMKHR